MKVRIVSGFAIAALATVVLSSCNPDKDSAGLEYMPDMYRSSAIEPYVDYGEIRGKVNEEVKMLLSAKVPPFGTVPYYGTDSTLVSMMLPYHRKPMVAFKLTHGLFGVEYSTQDEYTLAATDVNPLKLTDDNAESIFDQGKKLYNSKCAHCHGTKGDGNGPMVESGAYVGVPDYTNLKNLGDGQLFYSIYYGKGMMGAHYSILDKKEIWTLVHYIRKFQDSNYGPGSVTAVEVEEDIEVAENDQ